MIYIGSIATFRLTTKCRAGDAVKAQMWVAQAALKEISLKDAGVRCSNGAGLPTALTTLSRYLVPQVITKHGIC
jgi:hypothetical protein